MDKGVSAVFALGILTCPAYRAHRPLKGDGVRVGQGLRLRALRRVPGIWRTWWRRNGKGVGGMEKA